MPNQTTSAWLAAQRELARLQWQREQADRYADGYGWLELRQGLAAAESRLPPEARELCVTDLYEALEMDYVRNGHKSVRNIRQAWTGHLKAYFGLFRVCAITSERVDFYVQRRLEDGAANATINRELAVIARMFSLAVRAGKIASKPFIPHLTERNVRKGFLPDSQYEALARETGKIGIWLRAMFEISYTYAWRKTELLHLRVRQVDFGERTISLDAGETKNGEGRTVQITDQIFELLRHCCAGKGPEDFVFTRGKEANGRKTKTPDGRIIDFRDAWQQATQAAGCEGLLFHDLRRSGARRMRKVGIPEGVIMKIGGWRTRSVFERYAIVDPSDIRTAVGKLEKADQERREQGRADQQREAATRKVK